MDDMPADALIILPVRNVVLFPGPRRRRSASAAASLAAAQEAVRPERRIGVLLQRQPEVDDPAGAT